MSSEGKPRSEADELPPRAPDSPAPDSSPALYFFPEDEVTEQQLRDLLEDGTREQKCWVYSHLLRFAQWDDIWLYVSRDEIRDAFAEIELPDNLRRAWARMLKVESVGVEVGG